MIRTEKEYQKALMHLKKDEEFLVLQKGKLRELQLTQEQIEVAMEPSISFNEQLKDEVDYYEKIKRGDFHALYNLSGIGRCLIGLRIHLDITQADLAKKLGVSEAQVSRDERNEYHGITVERVQRILDALGVKMKSEIELQDHIAV